MHSSIHDEKTGKSTQKRPKGAPENEQTGHSNMILTKDSFKSALVEFVVDTNQPFSIVDNPKFQKLVYLISKDSVATQMPGRTLMTSNVQEHYARMKQVIIQELVQLKSKVSLVIDCWTSSNGAAFQGVIARYIGQDWILRTFPLDLTALSGPHSGDNIAHALLPVVSEFGIIEKIGTITTDNAGNMDTFFASFANLMEAKGQTFDKCNQRVRCLAHIVNLSAKSAIESFEKGNYAHLQKVCITEDFGISNHIVHYIQASLFQVKMDGVCKIYGRVLMQFGHPPSEERF